MASLCATCLQTDFSYCFDPSTWIRGSGELSDGEITHHLSLKDLRNAAIQGCQLCQLFWDECDFTFNEDELTPYTRYEDKKVKRRKKAAQKYLERFRPCRLMPFSADAPHEKYFPPGGAVVGFRYISYPSSKCFQVAPVAGENTSIATRNLDHCTDLDICRTWLTECSTKHDACPKIGSSSLPTRVLDLGSALQNEDPRLIATHGQKGQYATLSHCWGLSKPPMTTKANLSDHMCSIPFHTMPRTFQDAVIIVRDLGYQYLWIDSHCIVQDDEADWQQECAFMADIYESCAFTLAAPQASDCRAGIPRGVHPLLARASCEIPVLWRSSSQSETIRISAGWDWKHNYFGLEDSCLASRAWIFQERLLSPRMLYFGAEQLQFECASTQCIEQIRYPLFPQMFKTNEVMQLPKASLDFPSRGEGLEAWYYMVHTYSNLYMSNGSDKLPALSGIAARFARKLGDEYVGGLWRDDIVCGLIYAVQEGGTVHSKYPALDPGPSWAWYTCDQQVGTLATSRNRFLVEWTGTISDLSLMNTDDAFCPLVDVLSVPKIQNGNNPFGGLINTRLTLLARLNETFLFHQNVHRADDDEEIGIITPDYKMENYPEGPCIMLPLALKGKWASGESRRRSWFALAVVVVTDMPNTFRRVGMINSNKDERGKGCDDAHSEDHDIVQWLVSNQPREAHLI